jgi:hypothetical protein
MFGFVVHLISIYNFFSMVSENRLDDYSQKVNAFLKTFYSRLLEYPYQINFHQNDDDESYFLEIKIKSVSNSQTPYLILNSQDEKITISFSGHHCHFGGWHESNFEEDIKSAISTFEEIMEEKLIVALYYKNKIFLGSIFLENQEQFDNKRLLKEWKFGKPNRINFERFILNE